MRGWRRSGRPGARARATARRARTRRPLGGGGARPGCPPGCGIASNSLIWTATSASDPDPDADRDDACGVATARPPSTPSSTPSDGACRFRSTSCPGASRRGFSIPFAAAIDCQSALARRVREALHASSRPRACASGCVPGVEAPPAPPAPGRPGLPVSRNANCDLLLRERDGAGSRAAACPSGEKNSSVSSSESIIPSNWNEPQTKRTAARGELVLLARLRLGRDEVGDLLRQLAHVVAPASLPGGCGEPTSNQSVSVSFVVPAPTNWRAGEPRWSPAPGGCTSWFAKLTLSVSGLNWTVDQRVGLDLVLEVRVELAQLGLGEVGQLRPAAPAVCSVERLVGDLQLLDRDHAVLRVQRRRLQLHRQAAPGARSGPARWCRPGASSDDLAVGAAATGRRCERSNQSQRSKLAVMPRFSVSVP